MLSDEARQRILIGPLAGSPSEVRAVLESNQRIRIMILRERLGLPPETSPDDVLRADYCRRCLRLNLPHDTHPGDLELAEYLAEKSEFNFDHDPTKGC